MLVQGGYASQSIVGRGRGSKEVVEVDGAADGVCESLGQGGITKEKAGGAASHITGGLGL